VLFGGGYYGRGRWWWSRSCGRGRMTVLPLNSRLLMPYFHGQSPTAAEVS